MPLRADYDAGEKIMEFLVPSLSRGERVYGVELDAITGELGCPCEAFKDYLNGSKMPYRLEIAGTMAEQIAKQKGKRLLPLVTRPPSKLCPHCRKVRAYVKRHGWLTYFEQREEWLLEKLEAVA